MYSIHKYKFGNNPQTCLHLKHRKSLIPLRAKKELYFNQYARLAHFQASFQCFLKSSLETSIQLRLHKILQ